MADPGQAQRRELDGVRLLVVDGTNVLYALRRSPQPLPAPALIGRIRAVVPPAVAIIVVLDGSPDHGLATRRLASGVEVRYAGREPADRLIARLSEDGASGVLVVTDDAELSWEARRAGARTVRNQWLLRQLSRQRLVASSAARPRPPLAQPSASDEDALEPGSRRWAPGRGATRKRGNARRSPKRGG